MTPINNNQNNINSLEEDIQDILKDGDIVEQLKVLITTHEQQARREGVEVKDVLSLIKYHCEKRDEEFFNVARKVSTQLQEAGKAELALYILAQLGETETFTTQDKKGDIKKEYTMILDEAFEDKTYLLENPQMLEEDALFEQVLKQTWKWIEKKFLEDKTIVHKEETINNNQMSELRKKIESIKSEVQHIDVGHLPFLTDGEPKGKKIKSYSYTARAIKNHTDDILTRLEELSTLISHERAEAYRAGAEDFCNWNVNNADGGYINDLEEFKKSEEYLKGVNHD